jgi:predicted LPLAT superfamily acyltransferase
MSKWKGKTRGGLLGHKLFVIILKYLGLSPAYFVLRFVALYFVFFAPKGFKAQWYYFRKIHNRSVLFSIFKIYQNYHIFGQVLLDRVALLAGFEKKFTFNFDGEEYLHQMVKEGKGGILISAHVGNWEIAGNLLKRLNTKVNVVTGQRSINIIEIKNDISHIFEINNALKRNELICMHADRFIEGSKTIEKTFMGNSALFPQGPFLLAEKFNAPYSFVYALKETNKHYHFFATPAKTSNSIDEILNQYVAHTEDKVKAYPEQWFNYYQFWKIK